MWPFRKKPASVADPDFINGHRVRHSGATCPLCDADPDAWCEPYCKALDVMDYR